MKIKFNDQYVSKKESDESYVVMDLSDTKNQYYKIKGISAVIYENLEKQVEIEDIKKAILEEYDVEEKVVSADIEKLICDLDRLNIITVI